MKRTALKRTAWLDRRTTTLERHTPLARVSTKRAAKLAAAGRRLPRPKDTGPDRATRELVYERDEWLCFCCGRPLLNQPRSLQHRDDRGMGGTSDPLINSPANLILLAGTATTGCHGRVEQRRPEDNDKGYWLKDGQDPATTPVWHWRYGRVLLGHDGSVTPVEAGAA